MKSQTFSGSDERAVTDVAHVVDDSEIRILVVDDDRSMREGCALTLRAGGRDVAVAERGDVALQMMRRCRYHIILVDLRMPGMSGLDVLRSTLASQRDAIVIIMTGNADIQSNMAALQEGAWDYLSKPFTAIQLQLLVDRAVLQVQQMRKRRIGHLELVPDSGHGVARHILGTSDAFRKALELAHKVARTDASVMITGESGTGKEMVAQFIHQQSARASGPFVPLNCAALPENLLESEMFGHRKGAFTGADRDKRGLLEAANHGTMFLDELADMPRSIQAKLLRVLQDGVIRHVGSEHSDATVDVRFISATNSDIRTLVNDGTIRGDLAYRLRVVPIALPPLRERREDIPLLARHFLAYYWERHRKPQEIIPELTPSALEFLRAQHWSGNVRELQHVIEHLVVIADAGGDIRPEDFVPTDAGIRIDSGASIPEELLDQPYLSAREAVLLEFERSYLMRLAVRGPRNISRAARLADVNRATLYRLMRRHPDAVAGWILDDE